MKNSCRYLLIFGIAYTLGIWGFSAYYFHSQVKKMEALFDQANEAIQTGKNYMVYLRPAADLIGQGFYRNNWKAASVCLAMGTYYLDFGQYERAIPWLQMDEKLNHKEPFQYMEIRTFENLGCALWKVHLFEQAEYYMEKALKSLKKYDHSNYNELDKALFYRRYGTLKSQNQKYLDALTFFQNSRDFLLLSKAKENHRKILSGNNAIQTAYCYYKLDDPNNALTYCNLAKEYFMGTKRYKYFSSELFVLYARIYIKTDHLELAKSALSSSELNLDYTDFPTFSNHTNLKESLR